MTEPGEHPLRRYRADKVLAERWVAQFNDIRPTKSPGYLLSGGWCITLAEQRIGDRPMRPGEGAHIVAEFIDQVVAKAIVAAHNQGLGET